MQGNVDIDEIRKLLENRVIVSRDGISVEPNDDNQQVHTEDIEEIITKVPNWITRWGITMIFCSVLLLVVISILIPYPETIKTTLNIESNDKVTPVINNVPGRIIKVFIKDDREVKTGQPLLEISNEIDQVLHVVRAPLNGKIGFSSILQPGSFARDKQELFKIHRLHERFFGLISLNRQNINKIRVGQEVLIKLITNNAEESGVVKGQIDFVADEPNKNVFLVKVIFKDDKVAQAGFKDWMQLEATIITSNSSLFFKLFGNIINIYNSI